MASAPLLDAPQLPAFPSPLSSATPPENAQIRRSHLQQITDLSMVGLPAQQTAISASSHSTWPTHAPARQPQSLFPLPPPQPPPRTRSLSLAADPACMIALGIVPELQPIPLPMSVSRTELVGRRSASIDLSVHMHQHAFGWPQPASLSQLMLPSPLPPFLPQPISYQQSPLFGKHRSIEPTTKSHASAALFETVNKIPATASMPVPAAMHQESGMQQASACSVLRAALALPALASLAHQQHNVALALSSCRTATPSSISAPISLAAALPSSMTAAMSLMQLPPLPTLIPPPPLPTAAHAQPYALQSMGLSVVVPMSGSQAQLAAPRTAPTMPSPTPPSSARDLSALGDSHAARIDMSATNTTLSASTHSAMMSRPIHQIPTSILGTALNHQQQPLSTAHAGQKRSHAQIGETETAVSTPATISQSSHLGAIADGQTQRRRFSIVSSNTPSFAKRSRTHAVARPFPTLQLTSLLGREHKHLPGLPRPFIYARKDMLVFMLGTARRRSYNSETVYMAVNMHDRYLATKRVTQRRQGHLLALSCLYMAAKLVEETREPSTVDMVCDSLVGTDGDFNMSRKDVMRMERKITAELGWNLLTVTPHAILHEIFNSLGTPDVRGFTASSSKRPSTKQTAMPQMLASSSSSSAPSASPVEHQRPSLIQHIRKMASNSSQSNTFIKHTSDASSLIPISASGAPCVLMRNFVFSMLDVIMRRILARPDCLSIPPSIIIHSLFIALTTVYEELWEYIPFDRITLLLRGCMSPSSATALSDPSINSLVEDMTDTLTRSFQS